jgi:sugar lactone lactonase YvrE/type II secretory pathway pseudopilin PulG
MRIAMYLINRRKRAHSGFLRMIAGINGAIDLASIMVGVIVIGIIAGVIAATVFAVIPWAQDNAAKQSLDAVKTAQDAYIGLNTSALGDSPIKTAAFIKSDATTGVQYADGLTLVAQNLLQKSTTLTVNVGSTKDCYIAQSLSATGNAFYASNANLTITEVKPGGAAPNFPGCDATVPVAPTGGGGNQTPPAGGGAAGLLMTAVHGNADIGYAVISGYGSATADQITALGAPTKQDNQGDNEWQPADGSTIAMSYLDGSDYKPFYTGTEDVDAGTDMQAYVNPGANQTFSTFSDYNVDSSLNDDFANVLADGGSMTFTPAGSTTQVTVLLDPASGTSTTSTPTFPDTGTHIAENTGDVAAGNYPVADVFDTSGNLFIVDSGIGMVREVKPDGTNIIFAGSAPADKEIYGHGTDAEFNTPNSITIDSSNNLYVGTADAIVKVTPSGVTSFFANATWAVGLTTAPDGTMYYLGIGASSLVQVNTDATEKVLVRDQFSWGDVAAGIDKPDVTGLVADGSGHLYLSTEYEQSWVGSVDRYTVATGVLSRIASFPVTTTDPSAGTEVAGIAIGSSGDLFVSVQNDRHLEKVTPAGVVSHAVSASGSAFTISPNSAGLAINSAGKFAVTYPNTDEVQVR